VPELRLRCHDSVFGLTHNPDLARTPGGPSEAVRPAWRRHGPVAHGNDDGVHPSRACCGLVGTFSGPRQGACRLGNGSWFDMAENGR
jgi:hypothetical protein